MTSDGKSETKKLGAPKPTKSSKGERPKTPDHSTETKLWGIVKEATKGIPIGPQLRLLVAFGAAVYAVMHVIVLPLSAIPFKMSYPPATLAQQLAVHVFLVALPIALCVRRYSATPPVRSPSA